eukprot:COSAG06_NODE_507_length_14929_cov_109.047067_9_plen_305_part_00
MASIFTPASDPSRRPRPGRGRRPSHPESDPAAAAQSQRRARQRDAVEASFCEQLGAMQNQQQTPGASAMAPHVLAPIVDAAIALAPKALVQQRGLACIEHFDIPLPLSNPRLIEMFLDRNRASNGQALGQMAWAGEFVGKWLTHTAQLYRLTQHAELRATATRVLATLAKYQAPDGYLAPFADAKGPDGLRTMKVGWDAWGHYHICLGCLLWNDCMAAGTTGTAADTTADGNDDENLAAPATATVPLAIATKIGELMVTTFPGSNPKKFFDQGSLEQNMAILHAMALLYSKTKVRKHCLFPAIL